jgi:hypothetical protein
MANEEHLKILKQGVEAWNRWRKENPDVRPDLNEAHLPPDAYLRGADLSLVNLSGAILRQANLSGANLMGANLNGRAILTAADLSGAILFGVDFSGAILVRADLRWADLVGANLNGASLNGANLNRARAAETIFVDLDLSVVKGLDAIIHEGPSYVSTETIAKSRGRIPEVFLRGCGVSDWEIEAAKLYQPNLSREKISDILYRIHDLRADRAIQINKLFISYSRTDSLFVDCLEGYLNEKGIRFWRDVHDATAGRLEKQIDRAMRLNPTVLLVLSAEAVQSDWVEHEARLARELEKELGRDVLCPVALDDAWKTCRWPERLREQIMEYNILDFSAWKDEAFFKRTAAKLIDGLDLFYKG